VPLFVVDDEYIVDDVPHVLMGWHRKPLMRRMGELLADRARTWEPRTTRNNTKIYFAACNQLPVHCLWQDLGWQWESEIFPWLGKLLWVVPHRSHTGVIINASSAPVTSSRQAADLSVDRE
jgi:hypothetical protein